MEGLDCIIALRALGEESRIRILHVLFHCPMSVNELSEELSISQYNVSKHLKIMRTARLVDVRQEGKKRIYFVSERLKSQISSNDGILDLGCCTFNLQKFTPH